MPEQHKALVQLRHAALSLGQHRLRSALSALGVVCGVLSFMIMAAVGEGAKRQTLAQIEQLGMKNILIKAPASAGLSLSDAERLAQAVPALDQVASLQELKLPFQTAARALPPQILAVTPNFASVLALGLSEGRFLAEHDARHRSLVCVLGYLTAKALGAEGELGASVRVGDSLYQVVGVLRRQWRQQGGSSAVSTRDFDNCVLLALGDRDSGSGHVSEMIVALNHGDAVLSSAPILRRVLQLQHPDAQDYSVVVPQELLRQAAQARRTFDLLLGSIALVSLLAGGIGIMNIMLANIAERTYEIGLRRALGATREQILAQFLAEAALLTLAGALLGLALGLLGVAVGRLVFDGELYLTLGSVVAPLLMALLAGLGFAWYPAAKAAGMDPIEALRH